MEKDQPGDNLSITLRPAGPDDEAFLFKLYRSTLTEDPATWGLGAAQQEVLLRMQFNAQLQSYKAEFPLADHDIVLLDDCPVGRIMVVRMEQEIRGIDLALLPEYRNFGIGSALLRDLFAEAERAGKPFRIQVVKSNPAFRLYQRLGLVTIGESNTHYEMEWTRTQ